MCVVLLQKIPLCHQVRQLKDRYDDLPEQIEDLRLDVDGTFNRGELKNVVVLKTIYIGI
jgi:hypothetical protein